MAARLPSKLNLVYRGTTRSTTRRRTWSAASAQNLSACSSTRRSTSTRTRARSLFSVTCARRTSDSEVNLVIIAKYAPVAPKSPPNSPKSSNNSNRSSRRIRRLQWRCETCYQAPNTRLRSPRTNCTTSNRSSNPWRPQAHNCALNRALIVASASTSSFSTNTSNRHSSRITHRLTTIPWVSLCNNSSRSSRNSRNSRSSSSSKELSTLAAVAATRTHC